MIEPISIPGDLNLKELSLKCGAIQNRSVCKLVSITKEEGEEKSNLCKFEEVEVDDDVLPPTLIAVGLGDNKASIIAGQVAQGRLLLFDEEIYVKNKKTQVMGFR